MAAQLETVHARQLHIQENHARQALPKGSEGRRRVLGGEHIEAVPSQDLRESAQDLNVVVDHQDGVARVGWGVDDGQQWLARRAQNAQTLGIIVCNENAAAWHIIRHPTPPLTGTRRLECRRTLYLHSTLPTIP